VAATSGRKHSGAIRHLVEPLVNGRVIMKKIEFELFDLEHQLGIRFFEKYCIRITPYGLLPAHKEALMNLLDFVAFGVNQAPQKDRDEFFRRFLRKDTAPNCDGIETINQSFHLLKKVEEIQGKCQCPKRVGQECFLNKNRKGKYESYKARRKPSI